MNSYFLIIRKNYKINVIQIIFWGKFRLEKIRILEFWRLYIISKKLVYLERFQSISEISSPMYFFSSEFTHE